MPAINFKGCRIFAIELFDLGFSLGIVIGHDKAYTIRLPIPFRYSTIKYSIKHQGWINSFKNRFYVEGTNWKYHNIEPNVNG